MLVSFQKEAHKKSVQFGYELQQLVLYLANITSTLRDLEAK